MTTLDAADLAGMLGCSEKSVQRYLALGVIPRPSSRRPSAWSRPEVEALLRDPPDSWRDYPTLAVHVPPRPPSPDDMLTTAEVASMAGVRVDWLLDRVASGHFPQPDSRGGAGVGYGWRRGTAEVACAGLAAGHSAIAGPTRPSPTRPRRPRDGRRRQRAAGNSRRSDDR